MIYDKKIKAAVIGLGRIAWHFHLPSIVSHDGFELVAAVDPQIDRLEDVKRKYGEIECFTGTDEMYAHCDVDLVVIASPTCFHFEQVNEAFLHGCDVFCDKPLAMDYQQCVSIADTMNDSGRKLMVYQPHRITDTALGLKKIIESGVLGKIYMVKRADCGFDRRNDWQAFRKNGGGMLSNYGAHYIDQLFHIFGGSCKELNCITKNIATIGDAEDVVRLTIETDQDIIFDIDINMAAAHAMMPWYICGDHGTAWINTDLGCWEVKYFEPNSLSEILPQEGLCATNREYGNGAVSNWKTCRYPLENSPAIVFYDYCYDYFALDKKPFVPVSETLEVMRIINRCRISQKQESCLHDEFKYSAI